ncbi:spondin-1 [Zeugodacus cucurbitae]|uniref:spondin-1 n=1 Tax=Zeugodacus cucurbitae TaxID=28588 RepID=UPI0023D8EB9B|nr:spondin-1 [Zeugodacus cucurbitae]
MLTWLQLLFVLLIVRDSWEACDRTPQGATGEPSLADESFRVLIQSNPTTYIPGQTYNITLSCDAPLNFLTFTLVVESEDESIPPIPDTVGYFELKDKAETRFSTQCENMIESTNSNTKVHISVGWVAPTGGCVLIKAALLQHRLAWYMDDGLLTKRICAEEIDEVNSQTPPVEVCCACDEAKYELIVERKWSRNTHPHDFPEESWRTRFSEIIGASHTQEYRFWQYGALASSGLKEMAEHGATQLLEMEVKAGDVRTIIKAPGIMYRQNVVSTTLANVRVDRQHHVISLVSKIEPSPDWILGVAGLELCLANCTWINEKVLNLYPWDIGTDAGPSYMSPDQPQKPPDVVRRITSTSPNDQRSPFYEETGKPMKPMATLHVRRKRLYERDCDSGEIMPLECTTHPWSTWSECGTRCGSGIQYRTRVFKDPDLADSFSCQVVLKQTRKCMGEQCNVADEEPEEDEDVAAGCELTAWAAWTPCSRHCGRGYMTRSREYVNPYERERCLNDNPVELEQRRDCEGRDCGGGRRTQQSREEDVDGNEDDNTAVEDIEHNEENGDDNIAEEEEAVAEDDSSRNRPDFSNRNSNYNGRQTDWGDDGNFDHAAEGKDDEDNTQIDKSEQDVEENDNELNAGDTYIRPYDNRGDYGGGREQYSNRDDDSYDRDNENVDEDNNDSEFREVYDENGRKAIFVAASDPNTYDVLQQFCFDKPYMRGTNCDRNNVGYRNFWFYDADDRQCKLFTTNGCDDNKNKFRTLETCEGTCLLPHSLQLSKRLRYRENEDGWSRQFGEPESLVKKPKRKSKRRNRKRKQKEHVGNIRNYSFK